MERINMLAPNLFSGVTTSIFFIFSNRIFGWQKDGYVLLAVAIIHLAVTIKFRLEFNKLFIWFNYGILLFGLFGIIWITQGVAKPVPGILESIYFTLVDRWSNLYNYFYAFVFLLAIFLVCGILICILHLCFYKKRPSRREFFADLFVASILSFPCDFALSDVLSGVAVYEPSLAHAFVFATALASLDIIFAFHIIAISLILIGNKIDERTLKNRRKDTWHR